MVRQKFVQSVPLPILAVSLGLLHFSFSSLCAEESWIQTKDEMGVVSYYRQYPNSQIHETRTETEVAATPEKIFEILGNDKACSQIYFQCAELQILQKKGIHPSLVYFRNKLPWPMQDRHVVVDRTWKMVSEGQIIIFLSKSKQPLPEQYRDKDAVEMLEFKGEWKITSTQKGSKIQYQNHIDPGGNLSPAMVNLAVAKNPRETLLNIRKILGAPQ